MAEASLSIAPPPETNRLVTGNELVALYRRKFGALVLPEAFHYTDDIDTSDIIVDCPDMPVRDLQRTFIEQAAGVAQYTSWWTQLGEVLRQVGIDGHLNQGIYARAKHNLAVRYDGNPVENQGFELFEIGEKLESSSKTIDAVVEGLCVADQYSGGLLAAHPDRPRIVVLNGIALRSNDGGGETSGVTYGQTVVLNSDAIRQMAYAVNADYSDLLSVVTVHEVLAHSLENIIRGRSGRYFEEHFKYSKLRKPGDIFSSIHQSIEPVNGTIRATRPVREYGWRSPAEDFATSVDAMIGKAMQWSMQTDKVPRFKSEPDQYRTELVLTFMLQAAQKAHRYKHTPGIVGCEVRYEHNDGAIVPRQRRTLELSSVSDDYIMQREMDAIVQIYEPGESFSVFQGAIL